MKLIDAKGLKAKGLDFSPTHLWRLVKSERFPKPVPTGMKSRYWLESEIDDWIAAHVAKRDQNAA